MGTSSRTTRTFTRLSNVFDHLAESCDQIANGHLEIGNLEIASGACRTRRAQNAFELGVEAGATGRAQPRPVEQVAPVRHLHAVELT